MRSTPVAVTRLIVAAPLAVFAARRVALLGAALAPPRGAPEAGDPPAMALLVPVRNEEALLPRLFAALERLDYPAGRLTFVLVDDGSEDASPELLRRWAAQRADAVVLSLPAPVGKPAALNHGREASAGGDVVTVCDADLAPAPDSLRRLAGYFADAGVGAVAGFRRPDNGDVSLVARYAAVESLVHQLVTSAGKDRLALDPPVLGFGAYRRTALDEIGWFRASARAEDIDSAIALSRAGWRTRFAPTAVAGNLVAAGWRDYWRQHLRWSSVLLEAASLPMRGRAAGKSEPVHLRLERRLVSAGYADRLAVAAATALAAVRQSPRWLPPAYLAIAGVEAAVGLARSGASAAETARSLLALPLLFPADVAASAAAFALHRRGGSVGWRGGERRAQPTGRP